MPTTKGLSLKITAEVAVHKFFLREMLFFFIKKRQSAILDGSFSFNAKDFSEYIEKMKFSTTMGVYIDHNHIKENLKILRDSFFKRDKHLKIIIPMDPLLKFSTEGEGDATIFTVVNCPTDYINNALRYLDISLMLTSEIDDKNKIENLELERKIGSINDESLFGQTQDHKLTFCNRDYDRALGLKERAIFNILKRRFKREVGTSTIYREITILNQGTVRKSLNERSGYVNDGVNELRKKLCEISGNPETIITRRGTSIYKLIY
ncbi:MAG: hypothetical protein WCS86_03635 [Candidatus Paceibacterota bacterium]|jgi:hypothetical protein